MIKRYRCYSLNELFWGGYFNYEKYKEYRKEIRRILISSILNDSKPFIKHLICSSAYIYSLFSHNFFMHSDKLIEYIFPPAKLDYDFKLPQIQMLISEITSILNLHFSFLFKPAFYLYIILIFFILKKEFRIFILPSILNTIIWLFVTTTNDFRFTYPNYLIFLILQVLMMRLRRME